MAKNKIYCGNGKKRADDWITGIIYIDDIMPHAQQGKKKKYVKLNINIHPTPDQYGNDVEITVNDWKPNEGAGGGAISGSENFLGTEEKSDLPF